MSKLLLCPQGHQWQAHGNAPWSCPTCGTRVTEDSIVVESEGVTQVVEPARPPASESATLPPETPAPSPGDAPTIARSEGSAAAPPTDLHIRGYEILGELGRGGMGVVYQARDVELNRIVALKMVLAGEYSSAEELRRFQAEAEAEARMKHRHIVQIYDIGEHEGHPFVVLEFIAGGSLSQRLAEGPLPAREAAQLLQTVCEAVEHAHSHQVIHRDLKPANILLTSQGQPKVADFGLAKRLDEEFGQTQSGAILGTPSYMAPEQASGHKGEISPATDVYALGAILYECLTGKPPFQADTSLDTIMQVIADEPTPPRRLYNKVPRDLETIVLKCLNKAPQKRYASARELGDDLGRFLAGEPITARRASTGERMLRWVRRHPGMTSLVVLLLVALGATGWWWGPTGYQYATNQGVLRVRPAQGIEVDPATEVVLLREDEEVARFTWGERRVMWLPAGEYEVDLEGTALGLEPEQDRVDLKRGNQVVVRVGLETAGELFRLTGHKGPIRGLAVSPHGRYAFSGSSYPGSDRTMRLWDLHTREQRWQFRPGPGACYAIEMHPDGKRAVSAHSGGHLFLWNLQTGKLARRYPKQRDHVWSLAISPNGKHILAGNKNGMIHMWDLGSGKLLNRYYLHPGGINALAISADGRYFLSRGDGTVVLWDLQQNKLVRRFPNLGHILTLAFHPDGKRFLTGGGSHGLLCLRDVDTGRVLQRYPGHHRNVWKVAFSRDGKRMVSASVDRAVRVWEVDTGREVYSFHKHVDGLYTAAFIPTRSKRLAGRLLVSAGGINKKDPLKLFGNPDVKGNDFALRVWKIPHDAKPLPAPKRAALVRTFRATPQSITGLAVSPDGRWAVTSSNSELTLRMWDTTTGQERVRLMGHAGGSRSPSFSADGQRILSAGSNGTVILWDASTCKPLLTHRAHDRPQGSRRVWGTDLSADGKWALSCGEDHKVVLWDLEKDAQLHSFSHPEEAPRNAILSSDRAWAVSSSMDDNGTLRVWNLKTGKLHGQLKGHTKGIRFAFFIPKTHRVLTASNDHTVRLWNVETCQEALPPFEGHSTGVGRVAISADGQRVYSGDNMGMVLVWDLQSGKQLAWCHAHQDGLSGLAVLPDGQFITSTWSGELRLWDPDGKQEAPLPSEPSPEPSPHLVRRLWGHHNGVGAVAFSPDGKHLISTSIGNRFNKKLYPPKQPTVRLWEVKTGREVCQFEECKKVVMDLAFTSNGASFAAGGGEQHIRLVDASTGKTTKTLPGHTKVMRALAFTSDGKRMVSAGFDGVMRISDIATGTEQTTFTEPEGGKIWGMAVSPNDKTVLCGCDDGLVYQVDAQTGKALRKWQAHNGQVRCVLFSPDGQQAITGGGDGYIRHWDLKTGHQVPGKILFQPTEVLCLALSQGYRRDDPRRHWAVSGGWNGIVRVWDLQKSEELFRFHGHQELIHHLAWSPDGKRIASAGYDQTIGIWRVPTLKERQPLVPTSETGRLLIASADPRARVQIKQDGKVVVPATHQRLHTLKAGTYEVELVGKADNLRVSPQRVEVGKAADSEKANSEPPLTEVRIWRGVPFGKQHRLSLKGHTRIIRWLDISPDGRHAITTGWDQTIRLWNLKTGQQIKQFRQFKGNQNSVVFLPDGKRALSAGTNKLVHLWDVPTGKLIRTFLGHTANVWGVSVSRDGKRALSFGADRTIRMWEVATGKQLQVFSDTHAVEIANFSPDGKWIVSAGNSNTLKVWGPDKGTLVRRLNDHKEHVWSALFTPRGDQVITAGHQGVVRVWDFKTGELVRAMEGHQRPITCATLSADGTRIASASNDGTLRLWDLATGKELHTFRGHTSGVVYADFSPDGKFLLSCGGTPIGQRLFVPDVDFDVHLWEVPSKKAN